MDVTEGMVLVGISHQLAPVELRERCAVGSDEHLPLLQRLRDHGGFDECWLLSTCNRTEVLGLNSNAPHAEACIKEIVFGQVPSERQDVLYVHRATDAIFHLFSVAAGLKSQVLGESQILAQLKGATDRAREAGTAGTVFEALMQQAFNVGKRVRRETRVGEGTLSVARAGVELAKKVLGSFESASALVVGAGETGQLVARHLVDGGIARLHFANRTRERAEKAAAAFGGKVVPWEDLEKAVPEMDLTVVSIDVPEPVITARHIDRQRLRHRDLPPVIVDLSIPRGVDPELAKIPDLLVHGIDDLDAIVQRHHEERRHEIEAAGGIVVGEVHKFLSLRTYDRFKPLIGTLRQQFDAIYEEVIGDAISCDPHLEKLTRKLTKRLLDATFTQMKQGSRLTQSQTGLTRRYRHYLENS